MSCYERRSLIGVKSVFLQHIESRKPKKIHVFENGNINSAGFSINISPFYMRTWNSVLRHISNVIKPAFGTVKKLKTKDGKRTVISFMDLEKNEKYVACGKEMFKLIKNGYRTKSETVFSAKYIEHYKKTRYESPIQENLHPTLDKTMKKKRTIIYVFVNGSAKEIPEKFVLIAKDFNNWLQTLDHIAKAIDMPEGICNLCTVSGNKVCGPFEIQHGACYVAVPFGQKFRKLQYVARYDNLIAEARRNGQLINKHDITTVSSPLGLKEKFSICIHENRKIEKRKKRYERFDPMLLPLSLYEGEVLKSRVNIADKQLIELIKEKHIPTSFVEETERKVLKKEYYVIGMPSAKKSYTVHKENKEKEVKVIKAPEKIKKKKKYELGTELGEIERRSSRITEITKKRLEELEQLPIIDTDLKAEVRTYLSSTEVMNKKKKKPEEHREIERRASRINEDTRKRLEELEQLPMIDTDLKAEVRTYLSSTEDMNKEELVPLIQLSREDSRGSRRDKRTSKRNLVDSVKSVEVISYTSENEEREMYASEGSEKESVKYDLENNHPIKEVSEGQRGSEQKKSSRSVSIDIHSEKGKSDNKNKEATAMANKILEKIITNVEEREESKEREEITQSYEELVKKVDQSSIADQETPDTTNTSTSTHNTKYTSTSSTTLNEGDANTPVDNVDGTALTETQTDEVSEGSNDTDQAEEIAEAGNTPSEEKPKNSEEATVDVKAISEELIENIFKSAAETNDVKEAEKNTKEDVDVIADTLIKKIATKVDETRKCKAAEKKDEEAEEAAAVADKLLQEVSTRSANLAPQKIGFPCCCCCCGISKTAADNIDNEAEKNLYFTENNLVSDSRITEDGILKQKCLYLASDKCVLDIIQEVVQITDLDNGLKQEIHRTTSGTSPLDVTEDITFVVRTDICFCCSS